MQPSVKAAKCECSADFTNKIKPGDDKKSEVFFSGQLFHIKKLSLLFNLCLNRRMLYRSKRKKDREKIPDAIPKSSSETSPETSLPAVSPLVSQPVNKKPSNRLLSAVLPLNFKRSGNGNKRATEDTDLLTAFKNGGVEAFSKIDRRFRKPIFRYILGRVPDSETAEELTQDVFLKAYRARESYEERFELSTWLWTIARNTVFDWLRKQREEVLDSPDEFSWEEIPCNLPCPETRTARKLDRKVLLKLMSTLTDLQKRALFMRVVRQLSYEEISKHLGLSLSAAKCLVYRARRSAQELVEGMATSDLPTA
jgi:RNA polymerase sigma factor (sigma-70 family)